MFVRIVLMCLAIASGAGCAFAQEITLPVPATTIYPGDIVRDNMLTEMTVIPREGADAIRTRGDLIGRVARRTLFPGKPIGISSVEDPHTIGNGSLVQLIYERPGISISASGLALQSARTGDSIRVRNVESGLVVTGVVTATGTVLVGR